MKIIEKLLKYKNSLENRSSTQKNCVERVIFLEKVIKKMSVREGFCCEYCVVWGRNTDPNDDNEWGLCHLNNTFPLTYEKDWCYEGMKLTKEECETTEESTELSIP